jgi:hypothetical protein
MTITTEEAERLAAVFDRRAPSIGASINGVIYGTVSTTIRSLTAERNALKDALRDLLRCTEKHVFGDECKAQRDKARAALEGKKDA